MHWHGYEWIGRGMDRANEAERRPTSPDFLRSLLPPMRTGDWLLKPRARIGGTFDDVKEALDWLEDRYNLVRSSLLHRDRLSIEERRQNAHDSLTVGVDVVWAEWMLAGQFVSLTMVCCPNRHVKHPCPLGARHD